MLARVAKETLPFLYFNSIEGIRSVLKESWNIYNSPTSSISDKLDSLKLMKSCHESMFVLAHDGPVLLQVRLLEERLSTIEKGKENHDYR